MTEQRKETVNYINLNISVILYEAQNIVSYKPKVKKDSWETEELSGKDGYEHGRAVPGYCRQRAIQKPVEMIAAAW